MAQIMQPFSSITFGEETMAAVNPIQVQKFLGGIDYPTDKETLINHARESGADDNVLDSLQRMPGTKFNSPNDVSEALGKIE
jgi:hypothetical protein